MSGLPFTGIECPRCGYMAWTSEAWTAHDCERSEELEIRISQFLRRWSFRGEAERVTGELRELIAFARQVSQ